VVVAAGETVVDPLPAKVPTPLSMVTWFAPAVVQVSVAAAPGSSNALDEFVNEVTASAGRLVESPGTGNSAELEAIGNDERLGDIENSAEVEAIGNATRLGDIGNSTSLKP